MSEDTEKVVAEAVQAYTRYVVHESGAGKGRKFKGPTADEVLMQYLPRYHKSRFQTEEYHRLFTIVVDRAEALVMDVLASETDYVRCAAPSCERPIRARASKTCSKECGQQWRRERNRLYKAEQKRKREERAARKEPPITHQVNALYKSGVTVEEIAEIIGQKRFRVRQYLRSAGHYLPDARKTQRNAP